MVTLFGSDGSGSAAVEIALDRCGVPYRIVRASTWEPDSAQAELQEVNPLGQIPTLVLDDGSVLTETAAILIHLGLSHPASGLLPAAPGRRAQVLRGLVFIAANCYAAIGIIDYPERFMPGADKDVLQALRAGARTRLHACWELFADQFGAGFADDAAPDALALFAVVVSSWSGSRAHLRQARPEFLAALERAQAHPTLAPVLARHRLGVEP